jgi:hypothetical protein
VLRNRINTWCEHENIFTENQFGFRDGRSTNDAIFILHSIIQKYYRKKSKLWCIFIDYERAFDTVIHDAMWVKLVEAGISCKMLNMIKSLYKNVKACVKVGSNINMSEFFDVTLGVKQGEPLSPLLFILFINDIVKNINVNELSDTDIEQLSMYLILFADDIVLFTTSPVSLQAQVDNLQQYSQKWGLKINVSKTKLCVFESRKETYHAEIFINGHVIEQVDCFTYLGIKFHYTGNMIHATKALSD